MSETLTVEILDQNWNRKAITSKATSVNFTEELGEVGDAAVTIPIDDPAAAYLPNPDAANPYEGRFRVYEDGSLVYAAVIDAKTVKIDENDASISFNGKQRGVELGFYNLGRVDYLGWHLIELLRELTRNNVAKEAALVSVTSQEELYGAFQMVTGDPFKANYWKSLSGTPTHTATFDLGSNRNVTAIRVFPQWWKDIDTGKFHYHQFNVQTSTDGTNWTTRGTKSNTYGSSSKGHLYEFSATPVRYFRINVTGSTDGYARIAQIMVYEDIVSIGGDTTYTVPFIENDDSGNVVNTGGSRVIVPGAFQGDGVITHSYVTRLNGSGQQVTQTFRGVSSAVYFTSHTNGAGTAAIYVDGAFRQNISIPNNRYWYKGYDTMDDFGVPLTDTVHTLEVRWLTGVVQVDYFNGLYQTSWRPIEDDDPSLAMTGNWSSVEGEGYYNYFSAQSTQAGSDIHYSFIGDRVRVIGSKGPSYGDIGIYIDGSGMGTVSTANSTVADKQVLYDWSGSYGAHNIRIQAGSSAKVVIDRIEGNFSHTLYVRSRYETNLKVMVRMSEIIDSYIRFNHDKSIDLLGAIGDPSGTAIIEGTNEGGTLLTGTVENRYDETGSAVLAIVNVNGELPIKAFVVDREAVAEIGWKVIKLEQSDAADQFLLNRQALQYLREKRKPDRSYEFSYDPDQLGVVLVGQTTRVYAPSANLDGTAYRVGRITTDYVRD